MPNAISHLSVAWLQNWWEIIYMYSQADYYILTFLWQEWCMCRGRWECTSRRLCCGGGDEEETPPAFCHPHQGPYNLPKDPLQEVSYKDVHRGSAIISKNCDLQDWVTLTHIMQYVNCSAVWICQLQSKLCQLTPKRYRILLFQKVIKSQLVQYYIIIYICYTPTYTAINQ